MDPELQELLEKIKAKAEAPEGTTVEEITDEELAKAHDEIVARMRSVDAAKATAADIDLLTRAKAYKDVIDEQIAARTVEAEARAAEAAALLEGVPEAASVEPEPEPVVEPEVTPEVAEVVEETEVVPEGEQVPVAAAATPRRLPSIGRLAAARPAASAPVPTATDSGPGPKTLIASADIPGLPAGREVSVEDWGKGAMARYNAVSKTQSSGADGERIFFGTVYQEYPEDRTLTRDNDSLNERRMQAVASPEALAASGGICGPVAVDYSLTTIAVADRPVKGGLVQFGASRGGVRFILPHTLAQVTGDAPASVWTQATDANPGGSTKPHAVFVCQAVQEVVVDAVTSIVQFGNFQARFFTEQIDQYMATVDAVHSRLAEATLLSAITTGSTAVTAGAYEIGAAREFLSELDRAISGLRYRHRLGTGNVPLRLHIPQWFYDMVRADLTKQLPGDSGSGLERLATADATIDGFFAVRHINVTKVLDSPTGAAVLQGFLPQGAGQLVPWPLHVYAWLYPEGSWTFLDGGELNLGMVRDSTLNSTNNFQMFTETFEKAVFRGHESLVLDFKIEPSGTSIGAVAPTAATGATDQTIGS